MNFPEDPEWDWARRFPAPRRGANALCFAFQGSPRVRGTPLATFPASLRDDEENLACKEQGLGGGPYLFCADNRRMPPSGETTKRISTPGFSSTGTPSGRMPAGRVNHSGNWLMRG